MMRRSPFDADHHILTDQAQDDMDEHKTNYVHYDRDSSVKLNTVVKRYFTLIILSLLDVLVLQTISYR